MTREQLRAIENLTEDQINAIMAIHGKDTQASNAQVTSLQQQLTTAQNGLAVLGGLTPEQAVQQIATLNDQLKEQSAAYAFESVLRREVRVAGALDEDDVVTLVPNRDALRASQNQTEDIRAAIAAMKQTKPYLFNTPAPDPEPAIPQGKPGVVIPRPNNSVAHDPTVQDFALLSGVQRMELRAKNPALYAQLVNELRVRAQQI